jgi:urease accessory protein
VAEQSHALITTPGATKAYRNICNQSKLSTRLHVDGVLEWLPQEVILFDQSRLDSQTDISLGAEATLITWEIQCIGRPSSELPYQQGHARFRTSISNQEGLLLHDNLLLEGGAPIMTAPWGIHGHTAIGVMLAYPADITLRDQVREQLSASQYPAAVTLLDNILVVRAMAAQAQNVRAVFVSVWQRLRPLMLAREVCRPRIWNT